MPLYDYACAACGTRREVLRRIAQRHDPLPCACGDALRLQVSLPAPVAPDLAPYYDIALGRRIESRSHRKRVMQEVGAGEEKGTYRLHGARGTGFSFPRQTVQSVKPSGAYAKTG